MRVSKLHIIFLLEFKKQMKKKTKLSFFWEALFKWEKTDSALDKILKDDVDVWDSGRYPYRRLIQVKTFAGFLR